MHLNVHYLLPKLPQVKTLLSNFTSPVQILGFSETFLDDHIKDASLQIPGYVLFRNDRTLKGGGGVAVYVADQLAVKRRLDLEHSSLESLWLEVKPQNCKPFLVCNLYRPPDCKDEWFGYLEENLIHVSSCDKEIIMMGDVNVDLLVDGSKQCKLTDIASSYQLHQLISEPTRVTENSETLLDHVYVSNMSKVVSSKVLPLSLSDHYAVLLTYHNKSSKETERGHKVVRFRSTKSFKSDVFLDELQNAPWTNVYIQSDPNEALQVWYDTFTSVLDKHGPMVTKRVKHIQQPKWMTSEILEAIKKRQSFKANKMFTEYRKQRNVVKYLIMKAKKNFYNSILSSSSTDHRKVWQCIKSLDPQKESANGPTVIEHQGQVFHNTRGIATTLNEHFTKEHGSIPNCSKNKSMFSKLSEFVSSKKSNSVLFEIPFIDEQFVFKQISELKSKKATGDDDISPYFIKLAAPVICPSLCHVFNCSIRTGIFPNMWKVAKVTALHKKGPKECADNYRPISILCTVSKIIEKHIHRHMYGYMMTSNLVHPSQSGFRPKHSCATALIPT